MNQTLNRLNLAVQYAARAEGLPGRPAIRGWVKAALAGGGRRGGEVTVRFVGADESRALNRAYRGRDAPTNVLSFAYETEPRIEGDLVVCVPVLVREAGEQRKSLEAHCAHLIVHGMLHLLGYDHETGEEDARRMEGLERDILASLGFGDPYRDEN
jgi:probable rRNA maturation factor